MLQPLYLSMIVNMKCKTKTTIYDKWWTLFIMVPHEQTHCFIIKKYWAVNRHCKHKILKFENQTIFESASQI